MVWTTTGNLTNIRKNADFPFGVAMMPQQKRGGSRPAAATSTSSRAARPSSSRPR